MFRSPKPDSLSLVMVDLRYDLTLRIVENDLSAVAVETGTTIRSAKHFLIFGYNASLVTFNESVKFSGVVSRWAASVGSVHHVLHKTHSRRNVSSSTSKHVCRPLYSSRHCDTGRPDFETYKIIDNFNIPI